MTHTSERVHFMGNNSRKDDYENKQGRPGTENVIVRNDLTHYFT